MAFDEGNMHVTAAFTIWFQLQIFYINLEKIKRTQESVWANSLQVVHPFTVL
jgi:hypothetical protein